MFANNLASDSSCGDRHGEYAASKTLLGKGYNLGSLMARYQGLDWRDPSKGGCNAMLDPLMDERYDGSTLQPYEVLSCCCLACSDLRLPACCTGADRVSLPQGRCSCAVCGPCVIPVAVAAGLIATSNSLPWPMPVICPPDATSTAHIGPVYLNV